MVTKSAADLRQQMADVWVDIKLSGHCIEDILPKELTNAEKYFKDLETRNNELLQENEDIKRNLIDEKAKLAALPENYEQLRIDYAQKEREAKFYNDLTLSLEKDADRFRELWIKEQQKSKQADVVRHRVIDLERHNAYLLEAHNKLDVQNKQLVEFIESTKQKESSVLREKDYHNEQLTQTVTELEERCRILEEEGDVIDSAYTDLLKKMEDDNDNNVMEINQSKESQRHHEQVLSTIASQVKILSQFYRFASMAIFGYQETFHHILSLEQPVFKPVPDELRALLRKSRQECNNFDTLTNHLRQEDLNNLGLEIKVEEMAASAYEIQFSLERISQSLTDFSNAVQHKADVWTFLRKKFPPRTHSA